MKKFLITIAFVLLLAGIVSILYLNQKKNTVSEYSPIESTESKSSNLDGYDIITYQGQKYQKNPEIRTLLFLGIDNVAEDQSTLDVDNIGRADTIILFLMNDREKSFSFLPISRDTITRVDAYDKNDNYVSTGKEQINMQYSYGNTMDHGSILMTKCVSSLLYGTPVNDYLSLTMDGIAKIVDRMGGIKVTFPQDYTEINPAYLSGETLVLDGIQAEAFIRYRDTRVAGSNNERMDRANWLIHQLFLEFHTEEGKTLLMDIMEDEMQQDSEEAVLKTNLALQKIKDLSSYNLSEDIYTIEGENAIEGSHAAFYVDEEKLQSQLIHLFYLPLEESR